MLNTAFRTHTLNVERRTRTSDGAHGWMEAFALHGTVTGSLQPGGVAESETAEQERAEARWILYLDPASYPDPANPDVTRDDELIFGIRRFRVLDVVDWHAGSSIDHRRVDLVEVQAGN